MAHGDHIAPADEEMRLAEGDAAFHASAPCARR